MTGMHVVVVGASVAGVRTVQALRMQGFEGTITLIGEEPHHPYDKPPLSKENLSPDAAEATTPLLSAEDLVALDVDLRLGVRATGLDPVSQVVRTDDGEITYDRLVIATGVQPRTLPGSDLDGIFTLRTADDAAELRRRLAARPRVAVVGAGFIGAELASAAHAQGCEVTIVEAQKIPMAHILGAEVGTRLAELHGRHGVGLHLGARFHHFVGDTHVEGVALVSGEALPADLVVVGIGAEPATAWLQDSGLPIENGVECGSDLQVVGHPGIYAAGDVARWPHALYGAPLRIEHWTNASEHGALVASDITGAPAPRAQAPYVWSDQYGVRIQIAGLPSHGNLVHLAGSGPEDLVAVYADDQGVVVGAVVVDDTRAFMKLRKAVTRGTPVTDLDLGGAFAS